MPKIQVFCRPEWTTVPSSWKWILSISKYKNECQAFWAQNIVEKNIVIRLVSMFLSQVRGPEVVKCNAFVCTDVKKITNQFKHQSSITISIHTSKSSH